MNRIKIKLDKSDISAHKKVIFHTHQYGKIKLETIDLGKRAYCITYTDLKEFDDFYIVEVDEILNIGVKNMSHYSSAIYVNKKYIGKKMFVCILD